jgi:hypothetical protein
MAKYLVLIYGDETRWAPDTPNSEDAAAQQRAMQQHSEFGSRHGTAILSAQALQPTSTSTRLVHQPDGTVSVSDGPFVETKEALGGYYLLEAADLDEAIALAKQIPEPFGGLEIRPVMVFDAESTDGKG